MARTIRHLSNCFLRVFLCAASAGFLWGCASAPTPHNVWHNEVSEPEIYQEEDAHPHEHSHDDFAQELPQHQQFAQHHHQRQPAPPARAAPAQQDCWVAEDGQLWCWEPEVAAPPPVSAPVRRAPSKAPPKKTYIQSLPAGPQIDRAISVFQHARKAYGSGARARTKRRVGWRDFLDNVDLACEKEPSTADMGAFIRARVTIEAELEMDERYNRIMDEAIAKRARDSIHFVDSRVRELRMAAFRLDVPDAPSRYKGKPIVLRDPLRSLRITSKFGPRRDPLDGRRRFHAGVDFGAPYGERIRAAAFGTIVFADKLGGHGLHVVVDHGNGYKTHYSHLERIIVKTGQMVETGDVVGLVGSTGRSTGPHLHFALTNRYGSYLDPIKHLNIPLPDSDDDGFSFTGGPK